MKNFPAILFTIILCAFGASAQNTEKEKVEDNPGGFSLTCGECGCAGATASRWDNIYGTAVSIVDSDTIVVDAIRVNDEEIAGKNDKRLFTIDLIGIDTGGNEAAVIMFLQKTILNRRVNVFAKWKTGSNLQNAGVVYNVDGKNSFAVNEYLLEKGFVKYKKIDLDSLDDEGVTDCSYELFEKKARAAKLGIWAK